MDYIHNRFLTGHGNVQKALDMATSNSLDSLPSKYNCIPLPGLIIISFTEKDTIKNLENNILVSFSFTYKLYFYSCYYHGLNVQTKFKESRVITDHTLLCSLL